MKRFMASFLAVVLLCSSVIIIPSSAEELPSVGVHYESSFVSAWDSFFDSRLLAISSYSDVAAMVVKESLWSELDKAVSSIGVGGFTTEAELVKKANQLNFLLGSGKPIKVNAGIAPLTTFLPFALGGLSGDFHFSVVDHSIWGHVIREDNSGLVVCTSKGSFPFFKLVSVDDSDSSDGIDISLGGRWVRIDKVAAYKNVINEATLNDLVVSLVNQGESVKMEVFQNKYKGIQSKTRYENGIPFVYCDNQNRQYVMQLEPDEWAVNDSNNYYTDDDGDNIFDDGEPVEDQLINIENNTLTLPDGTLAFINNLIYDESTKSYYVDAHQEYDIDNNTYITNNYHYEYHINYTSITYIGQTEEYDEVYELYYQLPDGRNSADLTADELLALNTGIDVVPYIRSADTTALRSLYHFDANTRDSSYWNYCTAFDWVEGASLTYMDAGAFNGALYLDETAHKFKLTLPSALGTSDFTLQFRMYHSATPTPVTDSHITIGNTKVASFNGQAWILGSSKSVASGPGSWSEVAIIRENGTFYLYFNGVMAASVKHEVSLSREVTFTFGAEQQTYKYFDELRVLNYALAENGANYTPTAVPYDTNLALVLPDSTVPVADEYWRFNTDGNMFPVNDFTQPYSLSDVVVDGGYRLQDYEMGLYSPAWYRFKNATSSSAVYHCEPVANDGFLQLDSLLDYTPITSPTSYVTSVGIHFPLGKYDRETINDAYEWTSNFGLVLNQPYTFSCMLSSGESASITFTLPSKMGSDTVYTYHDFPDGTRISYLSRKNATNGDSPYLSILPPPGGSTEILYIELVEGNTPNTGHELVSAIAPVADDFKTPTLAVKTDLDITGYQIGGVRPSLPEKGLVWALVEGGRITSLQIYNGQAWEAVDGRIWTGTRWVPYYAYDVLLLKDLYDIVEGDPSLDYIYTQEGFWAWLQQAWGQMMGKLDQIINALGGSTNDPISDCPHVYDSKVGRAPSCNEPGHTIYTCSLCGHTYTELIDAHGHDWVVTNSVPDVLDEEGNMIEEGYDELTCSICDAQSRDYGEGPEEVDLFDALGDFIADGITWILDRLTELADSLKTITETFNSFIEKVKGLAGGFPLFFGAFMALIPEDLQTIFWFAVIGFVVLAVWKKWSD